MFRTTDEVVKQLLAGEDSFAEFKEIRMGDRGGVVSPNPEDLAGEMVALANAEGGAVFIGVTDSGTVTGISDADLRRVEEWTINIASNNCDPPLRPVIRAERLPGPDGQLKHVLILEIKKGLHVHRTAGGRWYVRVGSSKRDLSAAELARLLQQRGRAFVLDETAVPTATRDDLDDSVLHQHLGRPQGIDFTQLLRNRRVVVKDEEGMLRPTVAGLLCFSKTPHEHVRGASVSAAAYKGERRHSDDLLHSQEITGPVQHQIDEAVRFVERLMLKPARKDVGRRDFDQYALGAVQEAIVNAVAHRDYSIGGARIRLFLYADRLEVLSPGGLPNTITLDTIRYRQFTRNQLLVSFLSRIRGERNDTFFIEERGEGVTRIIEESERLSGIAPIYRLHGEELALTIWAAPSPHGEAES